MNKHFFYVYLALVTVFACGLRAVSAQQTPVGMRMEITTVEHDNDVYELFSYKDADGTLGYYLSLGRETRLLEVENETKGRSTSFGHLDETCIWLGADRQETMAALENLLALFDKELGTVARFSGRTITGGERLGQTSSVDCMLVKRLLTGKRLAFQLVNGRFTGEVLLPRSAVKQLIWGLKMDERLHGGK